MQSMNNQIQTQNKKDFSSSQTVGLKEIAKFLIKISQRFAQWANRIFILLYRLEFGQRDDDIYLITYPKSGTTMMQVILYQLCTNGKGPMDFHHIYDVAPWISNDAIRHHPVRDLPSPRIIKSHDRYKDFEKGMKGRFIYVYRNGMDVAVSLFHQNRNYNNPNLTFDKSFEHFMNNKGLTWFTHLKNWMQNSKKFPILYIRYEDLIEKKREQIDRILDFLELNVDEDAIEKAMGYSSFDYMKSHEEKFGVQPPDFEDKVFDQFIRKGTAGEGNETLSPEQKKAFLDRQESVLGRYENNFSLR